MDERKPTSSKPSQPIEPVIRAARRKLPGRKLLVASIGVATINYAAACGYKSGAASSDVQPPTAMDPGTKNPVPPTSGNLAPPNPPPPNPPPTAANLVAPPPNMFPPTAANLVAPPLLDAGNDGTDAGDGDGGR
jgi:hypothetical protein